MTTLETPKRHTATTTRHATPAAAVIDAEGLSKHFGEFVAVDGIDLHVERGEIFGLLGPNGAGKTTTIDLLVGLTTPTDGSVRVLGLEPATDRAEFTRRVAVQPQEMSLYDTLTVAETLRLFASFHDAPRDIADIAERVGLADQAKVRAKRLSGGQKRRLLLGVALVGDPELVVLDEPSAGLDPAARKQLWTLIESLRERGTTVLLTTHHMDEASALCDRVAIMVDGRIVQLGSPDALVREHSSQRRMSFDLDADANLTTLDALSDVAAIERRETPTGLHIELVTANADDALAELMRNGLRPRNLVVETDTLEDLFLDLAKTSDYGSRVRDNQAATNRTAKHTEGNRR